MMWRFHTDNSHRRTLEFANKHQGICKTGVAMHLQGSRHRGEPGEKGRCGMPRAHARALTKRRQEILAPCVHA